MRTLTYFFISTIIICSLSSCSNKDIKPIKVKFYTFGNDVQYNRNYPTDIQNIVQPYEEYYFSQITFEDKVYGWKGSIDLVEFSQLNPGFNLSSNINASKNLIKRYFNSSDNRKNPKNSHILYKKADNNLKSSNIPEFINTLKRNNNNVVLVYTEDDNIAGKNIYHDIESLRNAILNLFVNKKQIIIIYKPSLSHLNQVNNKPVIKKENKPMIKATTQNNSNKNITKITTITTITDINNISGKFKYPTQEINLRAEGNLISWQNFKITGNNIKYRVNFYRYRGSNKDQLISSHTVTNKFIKFSECNNCMDLLSGSAIYVTVELDKLMIGSCRLVPANNELSNCHCYTNKIEGSENE